MKLIAEASSNHNGNLDRSMELVNMAAKAGCDASKFQLFRVDELFAPEILRKSLAHRQRRKWELPEEFIPILSAEAHRLGIEFGCTPFSLESLDFVTPYVDFVKIASYELLWDDLLKSAANTSRPVIISTGMATLSEVAHAVEVLRSANAVDLTVLHCVSEYPADPRNTNLAAIRTIRETLNVRAGWSDHSRDLGVVARAFHRWDAEVIEVHIDKDGTGYEADSNHCWLPEDLHLLVRTIGGGPEFDGTGEKHPSEPEIDERKWRADPYDGLRPHKSVRLTWEG